MRYVIAPLLAAATIAAGVAAAAPAKLVKRQSGRNVFTVQKRRAATGSSFHFQFVNPENPQEKPHTLKRIVVHYPPGTVFDSKAAPQCHASDEQLQTEGPSACPADTKLGGGEAVSDTGSSGPFPPRYTKSKITQFNGDNELLGVGVNEDIPAIKTVTHTRFNGTTATTDFPLFPGNPPPDQYTPLKSLRVDFPVRKTGKRATVRVPGYCRPSGYWTIVTYFTYVDGVTQHLVSHSPCHPRRQPG